MFIQYSSVVLGIQVHLAGVDYFVFSIIYTYIKHEITSLNIISHSSLKVITCSNQVCYIQLNSFLKRMECQVLS